MTWFSLEFTDFAKAFLSLLFEGVPFLLLGSLVSGFIDVYISSERVAKMMPTSPARAIFVAGLLGFALPMCECGSVIIIRRFLKKGLPLSVAVTYMLAAPIVSPLVALSTFKAFTGQDPVQMVVMRLGLGFLIAVLVGFIIHQLPRHRITQPGLDGETPKRRTGLSVAGGTEPADFAQLTAEAPRWRKPVMAVQSATADFLDVAFFFIIGAALSSVFNMGIHKESIAWLAESPSLSVASMMGMAGLLALCSTTDAFVAATQFQVFSHASRLAFLLFGPVFDVKLFWLYGLIFKRRFVLVLGIGLFVLIYAICWMWAGTDAGAKRIKLSMETGVCAPAATTI